MMTWSDLDLFYGKVKFGNLGFSMGKSENSGFFRNYWSQTRVLKVKVISLPYIFQVLYVLCFSWPRYQVSVYRTIGPLVNEHLQHRGDSNEPPQHSFL